MMMMHHRAWLLSSLRLCERFIGLVSLMIAIDDYDQPLPSLALMAP